MIQVRAKLAKNPYLRALGMKVYPTSPCSMIVAGGSRLHEVFAFNDRLKCDCTAAQYGQFCAHIAAIEFLWETHKKGQDIMSQFTLDRTSAEDRGKPVALPRPQKMLYGGLLSGWFLHESQYGISVGVKALVTHAAAGTSYEALKEITEAITFVNPKWWYNAKKNDASHLMQLCKSLTDLSYPELDKLSTDDVKGLLNGKIGSGLLFSASVTEKGNQIDKESFCAPDGPFATLVAAMAPKLEIKENKDGNSYIAKPQPVTEKPEVSNEDLSGEVPF